MALHGHTKIELTDVDTGEVEVYEKDNMITNAISKVLEDYDVGNVMNNVGMADNCSNSSGPIALVVTRNIENTAYTLFNQYLYQTNLLQNAIKGIKLFNETLEENANNLYHVNNLVGMATAKDTYVSTNSKRGVFNTSESTSLSNGYKFVFDFGTDKANGTISSICLTDGIGGRCEAPVYYTTIQEAAITNYRRNAGFNAANGYQYVGYGGTQVFNNIVEYDWDNKVLTCIARTNPIKKSDTNSISYKASSLKVIKYSFDLDNCYLDKPDIYKKRIIESYEVTTPVEYFLIFAGACADDDYYYIPVTTANSSNAPVSIIKIDKNTHETSSITTTHKFVTSSYVYSYEEEINCIIRNNKLYFYGTDDSTSQFGIFAINLETGVRTTIYIVSTRRQYSGFLLLPDNNIMYGRIIIKEDDTVITDTAAQNSSTTNWAYSDYGMDVKGSTFLKPNSVGGFSLLSQYYNSNGWVVLNSFLLLGYLATINNLDEPIIKTSSQTMKITYTITQE